MHIESNILLLKKEMGGKPIGFPEGTHKVMLVHDRNWGWRIRCYDKDGNRLETVQLDEEK